MRFVPRSPCGPVDGGVKIQELTNELTATVNPFTAMVVSFENDP